MRSLASFVLAALIATSCSSPAVSPIGNPGLSFPEEKRISNLRQLTFEGTNAEAYWSFDGRWLTFQHAGENAKCDQIFRMRADGTEKNRVSNGLGRTTCSYYTPNDKFIVYSSTHAANSECPTPADKSKGYVWAIYPTFQFYHAKPDGSEPLPIEPGAPSAYNAELTTCKDGKVVFTSDRNGDLDLYTGRFDADGRIIDIKQVTNTLGYDGGAFFSPDCSKLVWRASRPRPGAEAEEYVGLIRKHLIKPSVLEIWIADADGSHARQVTRLGASSFAPYFSPDNKTILFSSNPRNPAGREFDLWLIGADGTGLEQITNSGTFDSFPMLSPDGKYLAFSSNRNAAKPRDTNIFVADWNANMARPTISMTSNDPADRFMATVAALSTDEMEGRGVGTEGLKKAEKLVASEFEKIGLSPLSQAYRLKNSEKSGVSENFFHRLEIQTGIDVDTEKTRLTANGATLSSTQIQPASFSSVGSLAGEIMDVGYGIVAPELSVDDYAGKNLKGKIALIRRHVPESLKMTPGQEANHGDLKFKAFVARERGAQAVIFWEADERVSDTLGTSHSHQKLSGDSGLPVLFASRAIAQAWLADKKAVQMGGTVALKRKTAQASNVIGYWGKSCGRTAPVVIGAHLDHLGHGGDGSLEPSKDGIHHGADDNASGVAALLETARLLKKSNAEGCYVFAAFTAEETGVVGSARLSDFFKENGIRPKAMLNMDMVGRLENNTLMAFGTASAKEWGAIVKKECETRMLACKGGGDGYGPSDHMPFYLANIPVLHFFTGPHPDYHRVSDTADKINATGGVQVAELVAAVARKAGAAAQRLTFVKAKATSSMGALRGHGDRRSFGAYLGTIPDYSQMSAVPGAAGATELAGVKLSGARPGSPADKAGLKAGDIMTAIHILDSEPGKAAAEPVTRQIRSLEDFMYILTSLRPGMRIEIDINRNGAKSKVATTVGKKE